MLNQEIVKTCREKLIETKRELLNRYQSHFSDLRERETKGDEGDQTISILAENQLFAVQQRLRSQLSEIESALARIERGTFGICEETGEPISLERLLAIPWTRLSIEGAEMRESKGPRRA